MCMCVSGSSGSGGGEVLACVPASSLWSHRCWGYRYIFGGHDCVWVSYSQVWQFYVVMFQLNSRLSQVHLLKCNVSSVLGIAALFIALLVRLLITFVVVLRAGFNLKEKVFITLAWMPKATVQVYLSSLTNRPSVLLCLYLLLSPSRYFRQVWAKWQKMKCIWDPYECYVIGVRLP